MRFLLGEWEWVKGGSEVWVGLGGSVRFGWVFGLVWLGLVWFGWVWSAAATSAALRLSLNGIPFLH